jgi:hypothetical protein
MHLESVFKSQLQDFVGWASFQTIEFIRAGQLVMSIDPAWPGIPWVCIPELCGLPPIVVYE